MTPLPSTPSVLKASSVLDNLSSNKELLLLNKVNYHDIGFIRHLQQDLCFEFKARNLDFNQAKPAFVSDSILTVASLQVIAIFNHEKDLNLTTCFTKNILVSSPLVEQNSGKFSITKRVQRIPRQQGRVQKMVLLSPNRIL